MLAKARVRRRLGGQGGRLSRCRAFHTCISRFSLRTSTGRPISCVWRRVAPRRVTVDEKTAAPSVEEGEEENGIAISWSNQRVVRCVTVFACFSLKRETWRSTPSTIQTQTQEQQSSWRKHSSGSTSTHISICIRTCSWGAECRRRAPARPRRVIAASGRGASSLRASLGDVGAPIRSASSHAAATGATGSPWWVRVRVRVKVRVRVSY